MSGTGNVQGRVERLARVERSERVERVEQLAPKLKTRPSTSQNREHP